VAQKKTGKTTTAKPQTGKGKRAAKKKPPKKTFGKKLFIILLKAGLVSILLGVLFFLFVFWGITGPVPSTRQLIHINNPVASEVYSQDGKILGRYYIENRSNVTFDEISPNIINALIATEDARFYEHRGIDEVALMRVLVKSILLRNKNAGGGSTLSQQIAKNLYPRKNFGPLTLPVNKLREAIIAYRLERIYTKKEILALYLNTVPFAENVFGIEVVAERFFSKPPASLTVNEAAVLVGMLKANNYYNPRTHPQRALKRRNVVIGQMVKYGFISQDEAETCKAKGLGLRYRVISYNQGPAPYFMEQLKPKLLEWCHSHKNDEGEPYNLYTDGLKITTTVDYNLQYYAKQSVHEYMKNLQRVFTNQLAGREPWQNNPDLLNSSISLSERYKSLKAAGKTKEQIKQSFKQKIHTTLFSWDGLKEVTTTPLDSLKYYLKLLNTGFIAISPQTGALKAWVGGIDFRFFKYDHVTAPRQTGSTFKPIVYLTALEESISPYSYFENKQKVYTGYQDWSPRNSHDEYKGYYSMEGALAQSINTIAVEVLMQTGISNVIETARNLGITADLPKYPSLALGVASISLKEMVQAYSAFVNGGKPVTVNYLLKIEDRKGNILETFEYEPEDDAVVSPENCKILIQMLEEVVNSGTGKSIRSVYKIKGDFAGKTGTTQNHADGWFIGMAPGLVAGCWVGADNPGIHFRSITYGQGAYMALPIVGKFFHKMYKDPRFKQLQYNHFEPPAPEVLAKLNIPQYKEMIETEKKFFDFAKIFGKEQVKDTPKRATKKAKKEGKKPIWETIKDIFRKKDRR